MAKHPHALVELVAATLHTLDGGDSVPTADVERAESVYRARAEMVLATIIRFADAEGKPVVFGDHAAALLDEVHGRGTQPMAEHPETTCRRCGGPNVSWFAPSPLWNAVMRGGSIDGPWEFDELICPTCFCILAEERGIASTWRVHAETINVELETVTPTGRVWDPETDLWVESSVDPPDDQDAPN
ncbi:hypothetical protein DSM104299_03208 [Baekduia alba]|nr:hypothetical protein DSM104299_03208 [Baekduia alba]